MSDAMIVRRLAESAAGEGEAIADPARLTEILAEIADTSRMLPPLMRLLRHPNPYLRSKVVKIIGRGGRSVKWVRGRLNDPDPRIRANAIEALWGMDTPEARMLLKLAAGDANNRVLGNALLGLYYLGECSVLEDLVKLSAHESALFRGTAAWAMGQTGDLRFSDIVRRLLLESDGVVRKRALTALTRIKQANALLRQTAQLHVAGRMLSGSSLKSLRRIMAAVTSDNSKEPPRVTPLQFTLSEGSRYVTSYRVNERPEPEALESEDNGAAGQTLGLLARYEITYRSFSNAPVPVKLRVQVLEGWAETLVSVPAGLS
jgi:HEAT repeat protein